VLLDKCCAPDVIRANDGDSAAETVNVILVNSSAAFAYDADVAVNALPLSDPVNPAVDIVDPVTVNPLVNKIEPLKYDAVTANDAQLDVPMNEPLKDPVLI
jgi:hypothetical protein